MKFEYTVWIDGRYWGTYAWKSSAEREVQNLRKRFSKSSKFSITKHKK